jgi:hypothetical protein
MKPAPSPGGAGREGNRAARKCGCKYCKAQTVAGCGRRHSAAAVVALWPGLEHHVGGVSAARRKREKPAVRTIRARRFSPAWAPSAAPTS